MKIVSAGKGKFRIVDKETGYSPDAVFSTANSAVTAAHYDGGVDVKSLHKMLNHGLSRRMYDNIFFGNKVFSI